MAREFDSDGEISQRCRNNNKMSRVIIGKGKKWSRELLGTPTVTEICMICMSLAKDRNALEASCIDGVGVGEREVEKNNKR